MLQVALLVEDQVALRLHQQIQLQTGAIMFLVFLPLMQARIKPYWYPIKKDLVSIK
jgi:hypothetical protein